MCMKYIFTLIYVCLGLSLASLAAQDTLFYENFQSGTLNGFTTEDLDGLPLGVDFEGLEGGFQVIPVAGATDFRALGVSTFLNGGTANNWLISPAIALSAGVATLQWEGSSLSGDPAQAESYEVLVSTTGTEISDFTNVISNITAETTMIREADLSAFAGSTIFIAFRQNGQDRFALTIDDILVSQPSSEIAAELSTVGSKYQDINNSDFSIQIFNTGAQPLTSVLIELGLDGMVEEVLFDGLDIQPQTAGLIPILPVFQGKFTFTFRLLEANFVAVDGPLVTRVLHVHAGGPSTRQLMEIATSTTCGFCPEATVDRQLAEAAQSNAIITLSVHMGIDDPLVLPAYAFGLESLDSFSGLSSATYNRFVGGSTGDFAQEISAGSGASPVSLAVSNIYDPVSREISVELSGNSFTRFDDEDIRFSFLIVEDSITGTSDQFDQANVFSFDNLNVPLVGPDGIDYQAFPDPIPASDIVYDRVVRDLVGGFDGIIGSISATDVGGSFSHSLEYVLPSVFDENQVSIVVLVLDPDESLVLQATEQPLDIISSVIDNEERIFSVFPNPATSSFSLQAETGSVLEAYRLIDASGRIVMYQNNLQLTEGQTVRLSSGHLESGVYTLSVTDGRRWNHKRMVLLSN